MASVNESELHAYNERQAARYVGVSGAALRLWRSEGKGPRYFRAGEKLVRYRRADLDGWISERAQRLGIPQALRQAIRDFEAVIFLLGKEYLLSTHLPVAPTGTQRLIFLAPNAKLPFHPNATIVPAGLEETRFGAGLVALKGKMFELFAYGLCRRPDAWNEVVSDPTAETFLRLVELGRGQA